MFKAYQMVVPAFAYLNEVSYKCNTEAAYNNEMQQLH